MDKALTMATLALERLQRYLILPHNDKTSTMAYQCGLGLTHLDRKAEAPVRENDRAFLIGFGDEKLLQLYDNGAPLCRKLKTAYAETPYSRYWISFAYFLASHGYTADAMPSLEELKTLFEAFAVESHHDVLSCLLRVRRAKESPALPSTASTEEVKATHALPSMAAAN